MHLQALFASIPVARELKNRQIRKPGDANAAAPSGRCEDHLVYVGNCNVPGGTSTPTACGWMLPHSPRKRLLGNGQPGAGARGVGFETYRNCDMAGRKKRETADIIERQAVALDLRKSGMPYRKIADRIGVSFQQAYRDVQEELKRLRALNLESAEELRQLEIERLNRAISGIMPFVDSGSANHVQALVKCVGELAKLQGLYEPEKVENRTTIIHELSDAERAKRIDELLNRGRARRDGRPASDELIQ